MDQLRGNLLQKQSCGGNGNILAEKIKSNHMPVTAGVFH
jgi:hypothetical protein